MYYAQTVRHLDLETGHDALSFPVLLQGALSLLYDLFGLHWNEAEDPRRCPAKGWRQQALVGKLSTHTHTLGL